MCGIFAYLNYNCSRTRRQVLAALINGLKRQEYRGYDSSGLAFYSEEVSDDKRRQIEIVKQPGRVKELEERVYGRKDIQFDRVLTSHVGIAHTRWATHGEPNEVNSHPQSSDPQNEFVVVHNGIITNYKDLKMYMRSHGYEQRSETDTELVVLFLKFFYQKHSQKEGLTLLELVNMVLELLEGAYALVVISSRFPNEVVATKVSSPLIVGIKQQNEADAVRIPIYSGYKTVEDNRGQYVASDCNDLSSDLAAGVEYFFASDASAIVEHTKRVLYLEERDVAYVRDGCLRVYRHHNSHQVQDVLLEEAKTLQMELKEIMKGSYDTFMEKEIFEQPESVVNTMRGRVNFETRTVTLGGLQAHIDSIQRCRRLIFISCGTSYHSCLAVRQTLEELTDLPIMIELASDLLDRSMPVFRDDVCVFVSQSGETADTLNALRYCHQYGAFLMGVTNVVGSSISRETTCGIHLNAGPEIGVASTKAYTSQIVALTLFACLLGSDRISKRSRIVEILDSLRDISDVIRRTLECHTIVEKLAERFYQSKSCLLVGRGNHSATCLEGALKVKEISYMHSEGIFSGELKHGPLALVDENMLIINIITNCKIFPKCVNALQQILARKARPLTITDCAQKLDGIESEMTIEIPSTIDCLQAIPAVIPLQLLALQFAKRRGHDVDCPRNLAKSVTVE